jgi:hypothetical protein|tara:strand:- start:227 stop:556 length:330 start_codon:yes stop_codon:yes gene_type:complete
MQEINADNDKHTFKIGIKNKEGHIFIDGFELYSRCSQFDGVHDGKEPTVKEAVAMVREIAWTDEGTSIDSFTDDEIYAQIMRINLRMQELGNVSNSMPDLPPNTDGVPA